MTQVVGGKPSKQEASETPAVTLPSTSSASALSKNAITTSRATTNASAAQPLVQKPPPSASTSAPQRVKQTNPQHGNSHVVEVAPVISNIEDTKMKPPWPNPDTQDSGDTTHRSVPSDMTRRQVSSAVSAKRSATIEKSESLLNTKLDGIVNTSDIAPSTSVAHSAVSADKGSRAELGGKSQKPALGTTTATITSQSPKETEQGNVSSSPPITSASASRSSSPSSYSSAMTRSSVSNTEVSSSSIVGGSSTSSATSSSSLTPSSSSSINNKTPSLAASAMPPTPSNPNAEARYSSEASSNAPKSAPTRTLNHVKATVEKSTSTTKNPPTSSPSTPSGLIANTSASSSLSNSSQTATLSRTSVTLSDFSNAQPASKKSDTSHPPKVTNDHSVSAGRVETSSTHTSQTISQVTTPVAKAATPLPPINTASPSPSPPSRVATPSPSSSSSSSSSSSTAEAPEQRSLRRSTRPRQSVVLMGQTAAGRSGRTRYPLPEHDAQSTESIDTTKVSSEGVHLSFDASSDAADAHFYYAVSSERNDEAMPPPHAVSRKKKSLGRNFVVHRLKRRRKLDWGARLFKLEYPGSFTDKYADDDVMCHFDTLISRFLDADDEDVSDSDEESSEDEHDDEEKACLNLPLRMSSSSSTYSTDREDDEESNGGPPSWLRIDDEKASDDDDTSPPVGVQSSSLSSERTSMSHSHDSKSEGTENGTEKPLETIGMTKKRKQPPYQLYVDDSDGELKHVQQKATLVKSDAKKLKVDDHASPSTSNAPTVIKNGFTTQSPENGRRSSRIAHTQVVAPDTPAAAAANTSPRAQQHLHSPHGTETASTRRISKRLRDRSSRSSSSVRSGVNSSHTPRHISRSRSPSSAQRTTANTDSQNHAPNKRHKTNPSSASASSSTSSPRPATQSQPARQSTRLRNSTAKGKARSRLSAAAVKGGTANGRLPHAPTTQNDAHDALLNHVIANDIRRSSSPPIVRCDACNEFIGHRLQVTCVRCSRAVHKSCTSPERPSTTSTSEHDEPVHVRRRSTRAQAMRVANDRTKVAHRAKENHVANVWVCRKCQDNGESNGADSPEASDSKKLSASSPDSAKITSSSESQENEPPAPALSTTTRVRRTRRQQRKDSTHTRSANANASRSPTTRTHNTRSHHARAHLKGGHQTPYISQAATTSSSGAHSSPPVRHSTRLHSVKVPP